jgi:uncharacterized phage-associated protein
MAGFKVFLFLSPFHAISGYNKQWRLRGKSMLIDHNREKLINAIIYFLSNTRHCGKTKLCKLLYYLDFIHFKETGRSVTGQDYFAWQFGPVPQKLYFEFNKPLPDLKESIAIQAFPNPAKPDSNLGFDNSLDKSLFEMKAKRKFDDKYFTERELRILEDVAYIFSDARAEDMTESSHLPNTPWDETIKTKGEKKKIDYMLSLDDSEDSLSKQEVEERIADREEISMAFGG